MRSAVDPNAAVDSPGATIDPDGAPDLEASGEEAFSGSLADVAASDLELAAVLGALSDPLRLRIVATLADGGEWTCGSLELPIAKSTKSHHLRVLGEAGIVSRRVDGKCRMLRLRREALDERFPGLLDAVLAAAPATAPTATGSTAAAPVATAPVGTPPVGTLPVGPAPVGTAPAGTAPAGTAPAGP